MDAIRGFYGSNRFLSNFYPSIITYEGITYETVEHAYQAAKVESKEDKLRIANSATPGEAKHLGGNVLMVSNWYVLRIDTMTKFVRLKFNTHFSLALKLIATGDAQLVETNTWGDKFWGVYKGEGKNTLGKILMVVRDEVKGRENAIHTE
jgi:ribA/ribD-fused uncharacterized protein